MADWMTVLTLAAVTLVCGCTERPAPAPPPRVATNVLIITVDTLRADRVGIYGATNIETPNMPRYVENRSPQMASGCGRLMP